MLLRTRGAGGWGVSQFKKAGGSGEIFHHASASGRRLWVHTDAACMTCCTVGAAGPTRRRGADPRGSPAHVISASGWGSFNHPALWYSITGNLKTVRAEQWRRVTAGSSGPDGSFVLKRNGRIPCRRWSLTFGEKQKAVRRTADDASSLGIG